MSWLTSWDPGDLPMPVALAVERVQRAERPAAVLARAADAGHTIVKYVGLLRISEKIGNLRSGEDALPLETLDRILRGASATDWWHLARFVEQAGDSVLPATPAWAALGQAPLERLNSARQFRHFGIESADDEATAAAVVELVERLLEAAAPLLAQPLLRLNEDALETLVGTRMPATATGPCTIHVQASTGPIKLEPFVLALVADDAGDRRDLYLYEKLTQRGMLLEHGEHMLEVAPAPSSLVAWLHQIRRHQRRVGQARSDQLDHLAHGDLAASVRSGVRAAMAGEWRLGTLATKRAQRLELATRLASMPSAGKAALVLVGPSGMGKSYEAWHWLASHQRVPIWLRASLWRGERLPEIVGTAAAGVPASLSETRMAELGAQGGWAIVVDGLNECPMPGELLAMLNLAVERLVGDVHLLVTTRQESLGQIEAAWPASWLAWAQGARPGVVELGPLAVDEARFLWETQAGRGLPSYDHLALATRNLMRVPILSVMALDSAVASDAVAANADELLERFVEYQTTDLERAILRRLAICALQTGRQSLDAATLQAASPVNGELGDALTGVGPYAPAVARLVDVGLLALRRVPTEAGLSTAAVAFGHDRLLQWFIGRWLAQTSAATTRSGQWSEHFGPVAAVPALAAGVGFGLALRLGGDLQTLAPMAESDRPHARQLSLLAFAAACELDPTLARSWLAAAWQRAHRPLRLELTAWACECGVESVLSVALADADCRGTVHAWLSRIRRTRPEVAIAALHGCWDRIARRPWLHPRTVVAVGRGVLTGLIAEGASRLEDPGFGALARVMARRLLLADGALTSRWFRRAAVEILATVVDAALPAVPHGPVDNIREFARFFKHSREWRAQFRPLVDLFAARIGPHEAMAAALTAARQREVGPVLLLERAFILATRRPATSRAALDALDAISEVALASRPVPMAAQSVLYVLSSYLEHVPGAPDWRDRFAQFERLQAAWLSAAAGSNHRWLAASGRSYKALFVSAHSLLGQRLQSHEPSHVTARLWQAAIERQDQQLALDLLDDLQILALARGFGARALLECEPLLGADWLPPQVAARLLDLLVMVRAADPDLVDRALAGGQGRNRQHAANQLPHHRKVATGGHELFLDFDDRLVLDQALNVHIARILDLSLTAGSMRTFVREVLKRVGNGLTGTPLFPEVAA